MKYFAIIMMLMASYTLAEFPSINDDNSASVTGSDPAIDLILVMLQEIKGDVAELTVKTDSLVATTDSLQATVGVLSLKVRNVEDDVADLKNTVETGTGSMDPAIQQQITDLSSNVTALTEENEEIQQQIVDLTEFKNTVETETSSMNQTIQQQITDLSSNVTALTEENEEIQQQVVDLSSKEQSDYDELNADIAALNSTIQDNYQELKGDVDNIAKTCGPLSNGYYYEWVGPYYSWNEARINCQSKGGDLAYHGLDTLSGREQLLCGYFNKCDNGDQDDGWPFIGLKRDPTTGMFKYLDGELSPFDDQLWFSLNSYDNPSYSCAGLTRIEYDSSHFLQAYSDQCDYITRPSICEFSC